MTFHGTQLMYQQLILLDCIHHAFSLLTKVLANFSASFWFSPPIGLATAEHSLANVGEPYAFGL